MLPGINWFSFISLVVGTILLLYWAILKGKSHIRIAALTFGLVGFAVLGFQLGQGRERFYNYGAYVSRFSQYSRHLHGLAERGQITELTNAIILFDTKFYPRYDPKDLEDVVFQLLKVGPYYQETNEVYLPPAIEGRK